MTFDCKQQKRMHFQMKFFSYMQDISGTFLPEFSRLMLCRCLATSLPHHSISSSFILL
jgi:hypothetical protein